MFELMEEFNEDEDLKESNGKIKKMSLAEKEKLNQDSDDNEMEEDEEKFNQDKNNNHSKQKRDRNFKVIYLIVIFKFLLF